MCKAECPIQISNIQSVIHDQETYHSISTINQFNSITFTHSLTHPSSCAPHSPPRTHIYIADFVLTWYQHACDQCGKSYKTRKSLSRHRRFECRFTTERPIFQCPSCNYAAKRSDNLTKHIKTHFAKMKKDFLPLAFQMQASTGIATKWEATA
ncbi:GM20508 [Drosophila sechellia]|uniref:GM20508 n=1 Tax=Drosophila sechellia TaxID=7238 RepID=B4HMR8_DROSE|nr:GM20508 [Drosophila sechellia]